MKQSESQTLHIYMRVSTVAQEDFGTSLESQERLGVERARSLGFEYKVWNEGGRSSNHEDIAERPKLASLINDVIAGKVKHIFVYDQSRLSRNDNVSSYIRYHCNKNGVRLYTKDGTIDFGNATDKFQNQILDAVAQLDNALRADRTRQGKLHRVKQNQWHGGSPVFGYKLEAKKLVIDPAEALAVKSIFKRYAAGDSVAEISKYLSKTGVQPRRRGQWSLGSLNMILQNTHYLGYYSYRDKKSEEEVRVSCSPIITSTLWTDVQNRRKQTLMKKGQLNRTRHFYLLRDLMYCGFCEAPIAARTKAAKNEHLYYCPSKERKWKKGVVPTVKHSKKDGCGFSRSMNIDLADKLVWDVVADVHANSSLLKEEVKNRLVGGFVSPDSGYEATQKKNEKSIKVAEKELKRADDAITELEVEHRLGQTDSKRYPEIMRRLLEQRTAIQARIESFRESVKNEAQERKWVDWVKAFGDEVKLKSNLSQEDRRNYLRGMIERIDVWFVPEANQHKLQIKFIKPIVGDGISPRKPKGYSLRKGSTAKAIVVPMRGPPGKRLTPVGNNSITVE